MALKNFWWLIIWLFLFGGVSAALIPKQEEIVLGKREIRWKRLPSLILALPYVIWAAGRTDHFGDTGMYRIRFRAVPEALSSTLTYVMGRSKDRGFALIEVLFKSIVSHSEVAFFFFIAAIQLFCLVWIYRKYSRNFWLSMFLFVASTDYMAWVHNGMRQFLAAAIIFTCLPLIVKKKYFSAVFITLIAAQIHWSALIFLPFIFIVNGRAWNLRTLLFIIGIIFAILFLDRVTGFITEAMEDSVYNDDVEIFLTDDGTNIYRVLFYSVPAIMSLIFRPYIDQANDHLINVCANLSIIAAGIYLFSFYTSGILVGRLPIFFSLSNYILIPWFIQAVFDGGSALVIESSFIGTYLMFFYYQMGVAWKLL